MEASQITRCRSCQSPKLSLLKNFGNFYLADFLETNTKPPKFPLTLLLCTNCSLVQLAHTTPSSLLYTENYGYRSGINQTMQHELKEIVEKARKEHNGSKNLTVVDIGANDGTLLSFYPETFQKIGVEPVKKLAKLCKNHADIVVNDFFTYANYGKKLKKTRADIITIISCFYDMENPNTFVEDVAKILDENGIVIIQQNYLVSMLQLNAFDNIVHEHLEYYSLHSMQHLLNRHNLEVFHVEKSSLNGGSFRTYIAFRGKKKIRKSVADMLSDEQTLQLDKKNIYQEFIKRIEKNKKDVHEYITALVKNKKKIYLYGASTRGNTLLQYYKLTRKLLPFAVERNEEKWGKYFAAVGIPIISEEQARIDKPDYLFVLPWFFKDEFVKREKKYLDDGGHFIFPLPELSIV